MEVRWQWKELNLYRVNPSIELRFSDLAAYTPTHWAICPSLFCAPCWTFFVSIQQFEAYGLLKIYST